MENKASESQYWVRSVARAAEILEALAAAPPGTGMSVTEVAQACGLAKSAAYATLFTLREYGLVADDGMRKSRRYRLGMGLTRLGGVANAQVSLRDVARPIITELTADTGMTVRLAVPDDAYAVIIDQVPGPDRVQLDLRMGSRELPHCTGLGKAILAELPEGEATALLERVGMPSRTAKTTTDVRGMLGQLEDIRAIGYAIDDEEDADGIFCIGSAIRDHEGSCAGAISVTGLKLDQPLWRYQQLGRAVRDAAARISAQLGYVNDAPI